MPNYAVRQLEGTPHYVVPVVMLKVGTFAGSHGPVNYPTAPLRVSAPRWDGVPVVVWHPSRNGMHVSAAHPDIWTEARIGTVFNTRFARDGLAAEAWVGMDRVARVNPGICDMILAGQVIEVSTGVFIDLADDGRTALKLYPDHLAVLPAGVGACSVRDGCGMPVRNAAGVVVPMGMAF